MNCICSALGLALVGFPHYTAALFLRLRPLAYSDQSAARLHPPSRWAIIPYHPQKLMVSAPRFILLLPISFPSGAASFISSAWRYLPLMRCSVLRFGALFSAFAVVDARVILSLVIPSCDSSVLCFLICNGLLDSYFLCHKFLYFLSCGVIFFSFLLSC